jgi:site-specific DNA-methyltransferase (adenine-specific)
MWVTIHTALREFGHAYVCCDWRSYPSIVETAKRTGMESKNLLVWDKGGAGLGSNYANTHEFLAFFSRMPPATGVMTQDRRSGQRSVYASNILRFGRPHGDDRQHNAAKPVAMLRQLIVNSTDPGERVLDLFGGSGSTAVAAAAEGRVGLVMEQEPSLIDVVGVVVPQDDAAVSATR